MAWYRELADRARRAFRPAPPAPPPDVLVAVGRKPERASGVTELPPVSLSDWDNLAQVKVALVALENGDFGQAAHLVDAMMRDDRIAGVVDQRLDALHSLEMDFDPPEGEEENDRATTMAEEVERGWPRWVPEAAVRDLRSWGLWLGVGFAQLTWVRAKAWSPALEVWHPRNLRWDDDKRALVVTAMQGQFPVAAGDGQWVIYAPYGLRRGWMRGLVRSLAVPWLIRQWALRDWAGHSEAHGSPAKKAMVPSGTSPEDKKKFLREVARIAKRSAILLEQGEKSPSSERPGYDIELLEATADGHLVFKELLAAMDTAIAIRVKGSNLTTEVKGASLAASRTHREVDQDKLRFDAETTSTCLRAHVLEPWAAFNHGDAELAPWPRWDTEPPEDLKAYAETLDKLGDGLKKLGDAAMPVDGMKLAERFDIPLRELKDEEKELLGAPAIYQYHLEAGIPNVNEVRKRLRLPPREGGDVPTGPAAPDPEAPPGDGGPLPRPRRAAPAPARALMARAGDLPPAVIEGQRYVDDLVGAAIGDAVSAFRDDLEALLRIVRETPGQDGRPDGEALKRALLAHYRGMEPDSLAELARKVSVLAELNGRAAVLEDLRPEERARAEGLAASRELGGSIVAAASQIAQALASKPPPSVQAITVTRDDQGRTVAQITKE